MLETNKNENMIKWDYEHMKLGIMQKVRTKELSTIKIRRWY